jgi:hypothetical protein
MSRSSVGSVLAGCAVMPLLPITASTSLALSSSESKAADATVCGARAESCVELEQLLTMTAKV